ncbi:MAG: hypothetical protein M5U30_18890 [Burkholderiaceae bacterium]|nr:hypothetical protein [Burkholderiaceae bacterium]
MSFGSARPASIHLRSRPPDDSPPEAPDPPGQSRQPPARGARRGSGRGNDRAEASFEMLGELGRTFLRASLEQAVDYRLQRPFAVHPHPPSISVPAPLACSTTSISIVRCSAIAMT